MPSEKHALSLRFEHRCAACRSLLPAGWHADHVVALADGGADDARNMQPLCPHCHTLKTALENSARPRVPRGPSDPSALLFVSRREAPGAAPGSAAAHVEAKDESALNVPRKLERRSDGWF